MQKTKAKLPVLIIAVTVIASCFLRFFQLLRYTDEKTGLVTMRQNLSYAVYALAAVLLIMCIIYGIKADKGCKAILTDGTGKEIFNASAAAGAVLFLEFLNQSYGCYSYIEDAKMIEYEYFLPIAASGVFALISCVYFAALCIAARGVNLDLSKLVWLQFSPAVWAFLRLISITARFIDIKSGVETSCELFFLVAFVFLWFGFVLSAEGKKRSNDILFTVACVFSFCMAVIIFVPRLFYAVFNFAGFFNGTGLTSVCYITLGAFSLTLLTNRNENFVSGK